MLEELFIFFALRTYAGKAFRISSKIEINAAGSLGRTRITTA